MAANSTTIAETEITYDRATRDYAILVNGQVIAYAANYREAEVKRMQYLADTQYED